MRHVLVAFLLALSGPAYGDATIVQCKTSGGSQAVCANGSIQNAKLANSAVTLSCTGLTGCGSVALGAMLSPSVTYGSTAGTAVQGNDVRNLPIPPGAGGFPYSNGATYVTTGSLGTTSQVLVGGATPAFGMVPAAAIGAITGTIAGAATLSGAIAFGSTVTLSGAPAAASNQAATALYAEAAAVSAKTGSQVTLAAYNRTGTWLGGYFAGPSGATEGAYANATDPAALPFPVAGKLKNFFLKNTSGSGSPPTYTVYRSALGAFSFSATSVAIPLGAFERETLYSANEITIAAGDSIVVSCDVSLGGFGTLITAQFIPDAP